MEVVSDVKDVSVGRSIGAVGGQTGGAGRHAAGLQPLVVTEAVSNRRRTAAPADESGQTAVRTVSSACGVVDAVGGIDCGQRTSSRIRRVSDDRAAGIMQRLQRAVEVVIIAESLGNCGIVRAGEAARLTGLPAQDVIAVGDGSSL